MSVLGRSGSLAPLTSADIPDGIITAAKVTADVATQAELDAATFDDDKIQTNLALLAFKTAVNGSLAKYNLQDQVIDEYTDATGVDDGPSTNHVLTSGVYRTVSVSTAIGGTITYPVGYAVHTFLLAQTGTDFTPSISGNVDFLIVAGGGGGASSNDGSGVNSGGGGAGGYRTFTSQALTADVDYTITVGDGGTGGASSGSQGADGGNSSIAGTGGYTTLSSTGGGGGGARLGTTTGRSGGSGGGGAGYTSAAGGAGDAGGYTPDEGYAGSPGAAAPSLTSGGGGGSAGVGTLASPSGDTSPGGAGTVNNITGGDVTYASGGAGGYSGVLHGAEGEGDGGSGGHTNQPSIYAGGNGGSGIVIIRHTSVNPNNITLQSTDTEAESQPTKADMVMLIEDAGTGVGTVNTHIKGHISRDSGTTFTEGVLVDEGDWGDNKRILAFHDLDISSQPADKTMCYKITTHSQTAEFETNICATSIGWR